MANAVRDVLLEKNHCVATMGNVLLVLFRAGPTQARVVATWESALAGLERTGRKAVFFAVIELESTPPDELARQAIARFFEQHSEAFEVFTAAVEGTGFRSATVRTIITAVMNVMPRFRFSFPRHVTSTVEEAASLALKASPGLDTAALLAAMRELRARVP